MTFLSFLGGLFCPLYGGLFCPFCEGGESPLEAQASAPIRKPAAFPKPCSERTKDMTIVCGVILRLILFERNDERAALRPWRELRDAY